MKGAERRAEFEIRPSVNGIELYVFDTQRWNLGLANQVCLGPTTRADCTAFIEREGLRAMAAHLK